VRRIHVAVVLLLPWPGAIGYRRFYQGVLIRHGLTRRVAYGTVVRLVTMASTAVALAAGSRFAGAWVGAAALAAGVTSEAVASRVMAAGVLRRLRANGDAEATAVLTLRSIGRFYAPLAFTSMLTLAVQPLVTFAVAHGRAAVESLAVLPVVTGLVFVFRTLGLAYQETGIALSGERHENDGQLGRFAAALGAIAAIGLAALAWTPLAGWWFGTVSGLSPEMVAFAVWPTRIVTLMPALTVLLSFQRATLVSHGVTRPITRATLAEVGGIAATLLVAIGPLGAVGAVAASAALLVGRLGANATLVRPLRALPRPGRT
jgi:progressive ankylosis protein